jgi:hypothetical protein
MSNKLIHNKKDILGAIFLAHQIENDPEYSPLFEEGKTSAYEELESYTLQYRKVSKTSFGRFFNLTHEPKISFGTLNNIVLWYTDRKYSTFKHYLEDNLTEIETLNIIGKGELEKLVNKVQGKSSNEETKKDDQEQPNQPTLITIQNVVKNKPYYFVGAFGIIVVALVVSAFYFDYQKSKQPTTKIDQINITNNDFREIFPTKESDFFSPQGEPVVWYAYNGSELDFYNQAGSHPITNKPLKMVTREFVKHHLEERTENTITPKLIEQTSVTILGDGAADNRISSYFKNNYKSTNPYQCKGDVTYEFSKSSLNEKLILCDLTLSYTVFSDKGIIENKFIETRGSGLSENEARKRAIENIKL